MTRERLGAEMRQAIRRGDWIVLLPELIKFVEEQEQDESYDYEDGWDCPFSQFCKRWWIADIVTGEDVYAIREDSLSHKYVTLPLPTVIGDAVRGATEDEYWELEVGNAEGNPLRDRWTWGKLLTRLKAIPRLTAAVPGTDPWAQREEEEEEE